MNLSTISSQENLHFAKSVHFLFQRFPTIPYQIFELNSPDKRISFSLPSSPRIYRNRFFCECKTRNGASKYVILKHIQSVWNALKLKPFVFISIFWDLASRSSFLGLWKCLTAFYRFFDISQYFKYTLSLKLNFRHSC